MYWKTQRLILASMILVPILLAVQCACPRAFERSSPTVQSAEAGPIRNLIDRFRHRHDEPQPPTPPEPPTPPQPPTPPDPPTPQPTTTKAIVGVWDTLVPDLPLAQAAHSGVLRDELARRQINWRQCHPAVKDQQPPPPAWITDAFNAAAAAKISPPFLLCYDAGHVLKSSQLTYQTDTTALMAIIDAAFPKKPKGPFDLLPRNRDGLRKRTTPPGQVLARSTRLPQLSAVLKPLAPDQYPDVDFRQMVPFTKDQNGYPTCSSQAATAAMETIRFAQVGPENAHELSPNFLATIINGWDGAALSDTMPALIQYGILDLASQPNYSQRLPSDWKTLASQHKALAVFDTPDSDPMGYLAAALARRWPTIIGIAIGNDFEPDDNGRITYARGQGRRGHAVLACGHDSAHKPGWTLIKNSWGQRWGQNGCAWIEDEFIRRSPFNDIWALTAVTISSTDSGPSTTQPQKPTQAPAENACPDGTCPNRLR